MRIIPSILKKKLVIENENSYYSFSKYGKIEVKDIKENEVPTRILYVDGVRESAMYLIPGLQYTPVFQYIRLIMEELSVRTDIKNTLLIGGAGFSLPKAYISCFLDRKMTVVENNPEMLSIAKKYFELDRLYEEFDLENTRRLQTVMGDGLSFLKNTNEKFDMIINDAFIGRTPDGALFGSDGVNAVYNALNGGGVYVMNVIASLTGKDSMPGVMAQEITSRAFGKARIKQVSKGYPEDEKQNILLIAVKEEPVKNKTVQV